MPIVYVDIYRPLVPVSRELTSSQITSLLELGLLVKERGWYCIPPERNWEEYDAPDLGVSVEDWNRGIEEREKERLASRRETAYDFDLSYAASQDLSLFPFQSTGVELMEEMVAERIRTNPDGRGGVLVFDEMGLGKTIEALAFISRMSPMPKKVLVICPNTLKLEWQAAFRRWLNLYSYPTVRGGLKRFRGLVDNEAYLYSPIRIIITNYETLRTDDYLDILQAFNPDVLIWDEAHRLRNWERKTARKSRQISAGVEIMMTGTPVVNHAGDLWSSLNRVAPELFPSARDFEYQFTYSRQGYAGSIKFGVRNGDLLKRLLGRVAIQRKKSEVLKDLPAKVYREVPLMMEDDQREAYEEMERQLFVLLDSGETLQSNSVLAQLTRLRQLCCDPNILGRTTSSVKTEFVYEFLEDLGGGGENGDSKQVVIFSNFEMYISLLEKGLQEREISYLRLTGKEVGEKRADNIAKFQAGEAQVILGTTQAGGEGVNLQVASRVILLDRWWSPVRNEQAIDRLHRIGQLHPVQAILPHCVESIDDALKEILSRKYSVINELRIQGDTVELLRGWREKRLKGTSEDRIS